MANEVRLRKASSAISSAIFKEVQARRNLYSERDDVAHRLRKYRLMRHKTWVPKAYQRQFGGENAIKMPITYRLVQTAVNAVAKGLPTVYCEPFDPSDQEAADEVGRASSLLLQAVEAQAHLPFLYSLYFNLFGDGLGVTKSMIGPWAGLPLKDESESPQEYLQRLQEFMAVEPLPFTTRTVDPLTFYPPLDEYGRGAIIESGWRNRAEVFKSLRIAPDSDGKYSRIPDDKSWADLEFPPGLPPTVRVDEVWTKDECAIVIGGEQDVFIYENPTGDHPYVWGYAEPTGVHDPTNVGMSVVYPLYYLAPWIDTTVAIMTAWAMFAAPTPYTTQDPDPRIRPTTEQKIEMFQPGKMYHFPTGRKPGIMEPPQVGNSLLGFMNFLIESADRGGLPSLVSGAGVGSRLPALTFQAAFEAATDRLLPGVHSAEKIIAHTIAKWHAIIAANDMPVKVNGMDYTADPDGKVRAWATLNPKQLRKRRQLTVKLAVESTQDLIAKGTHAQFMMSAQLWDMAQAMRFSGVKDVSKTKAGIAADTAWRQMLPALAQMILATDEDYAAWQQEQMAALVAQQQAAQSGEPAGAPPGEMGMQTMQSTAGPGQTRQQESAMIRMANGGQVYDGAPPEIGGHAAEYPGAPPGPGRNRKNVPAGRGGGRRGIPTQKPRGNRRSPFGRR